MAQERDYVDKGVGNGIRGGDEAQKEGIIEVPSIVMYRDGRLIDIRAGGFKDGYVGANYQLFDWYIETVLLGGNDEWRFNNSFDLHQVK